MRRNRYVQCQIKCETCVYNRLLGFTVKIIKEAELEFILRSMFISKIKKDIWFHYEDRLVKHMNSYLELVLFDIIARSPLFVLVTGDFSFLSTEWQRKDITATEGTKTDLLPMVRLTLTKFLFFQIYLLRVGMTNPCTETSFSILFLRNSVRKLSTLCDANNKLRIKKILMCFWVAVKY